MGYMTYEQQHVWKNLKEAYPNKITFAECIAYAEAHNVEIHWLWNTLKTYGKADD